jgi:hypothetical protein
MHHPTASYFRRPARPLPVPALRGRHRLPPRAVLSVPRGLGRGDRGRARPPRDDGSGASLPQNLGAEGSQDRRGAPPEPFGDGTQASFEPSLKSVESDSSRQVFGSGLPKIDSVIVSKIPISTLATKGRA